jgi:transposase
MTREAMEARRLAAAAAFKAGVSQASVAREFGVSQTTTSRWAFALGHGVSLARRKATGRRVRVHRTVLGTLVREREYWTGREFAERIEKRLGVRYHVDHALRIGKKLAPERFGWLSRRSKAQPQTNGG